MSIPSLRFYCNTVLMSGAREDYCTTFTWTCFQPKRPRTQSPQPLSPPRHSIEVVESIEGHRNTNGTNDLPPDSVLAQRCKINIGHHLPVSTMPTSASTRPIRPSRGRKSNSYSSSRPIEKTEIKINVYDLLPVSISMMGIVTTTKNNVNFSPVN
jgi:hypothetical protein